MSSGPLRFLHASDFHLEMPLSGVTDLPDHLREMFLTAPRRAAERIFDAAIAERVDFMLLAGDILDVQAAGPQAAVFLCEQFARLAEKEIQVYWCAGGVDPPHRWPVSLRLPDNVKLFAGDRIEECLFNRHGEPAARIMGASFGARRTIHIADFRAPAVPNLPNIALVHGQFVNDEASDGESPARDRERDPFSPTAIDYWALGGEHAADTPMSGLHTAHFPGSPQGRNPGETGPHGCTLVEIDHAGRAQLAPQQLDLVRWHNPRVAVNEGTTRTQLESMLREQIAPLAKRGAGVDLLVCWTVTGTGPLLRQLRRGPLVNELLGWLQEEFGRKTPAVWSVSLAVEPPALWLNEGRGQETLLGDFLKLVSRYEEQPVDELRPPELLREHANEETAPELAEQTAREMAELMIDIAEPRERQRLLREAAALGVDLLSGEGWQS